MRKGFSILLLIAVIALVASPAFASTVPDKILKTRVVLADEVLTTGGGWLVYSVGIYAATGTNAQVGLYNCDTILGMTNTTIKAENGEPTRYTLSSDNALKYPIEFTEGLTVNVHHGYAIIQYED